MTAHDLNVSKFDAYKDPKRGVGSQKEVPELNVEQDRVSVKGYQAFQIIAGKVEQSSLSAKYIKLYRYLGELNNIVGRESSFLDIGCSAGLLCFLAKDAGFNSVTGLDHDPEYVGILTQASQASGLEVKPIIGNWREADDSYDVVAAIALIHWIFSVTAAEGSFESIFTHLAAKARRYLMVEWVAPDDGVIQRFKHTSRNPEVQKEAYTVENFLAAGERLFGPIDAIIDNSRTRRVYIFRRSTAARNIISKTFSSTVYDHETCIRKVFQERAMAKHPQMVARERKALSLLVGSSGFPVILGGDEGEVYLTRAGKPLSASNMPVDADRQGEALVTSLARKGIQHNDIHPGNLLVHDGKLHLIDFAWASFGSEPRGYLPDRIGVGQGVRQPGDGFDDLVMMKKSIQLARDRI